MGLNKTLISMPKNLKKNFKTCKFIILDQLGYGFSF